MAESFWTIKVGPIPYLTNGEPVILLRFNVHDPFNDGYELDEYEATALILELQAATRMLREAKGTQQAD